MATTTQVADLARNVARRRRAVESILAPNADPHEYELRPHDVQALADADLVLRSGGDVDEWLDEAIDGSGTHAPVVTLGDEVELRRRRPALVAGPAQRAIAVAVDRRWARAAPRLATHARPTRRGCAPSTAASPLHRQGARRRSASS